MVNYDGRRFRSAQFDPDWPAPVGVYRQAGDLLWAELGGSEVRRGSLVGTCVPDGTVDFGYSMVNNDGSAIPGYVTGVI
jgi:hypothetical protein